MALDGASETTMSFLVARIEGTTSGAATADNGD